MCRGPGLAAKTNSQPVESLLDPLVCYDNLGSFICVTGRLNLIVEKRQESLEGPLC